MVLCRPFEIRRRREGSHTAGANNPGIPQKAEAEGAAEETQHIRSVMQNNMPQQSTSSQCPYIKYVTKVQKLDRRPLGQNTGDRVRSPEQLSQESKEELHWLQTAINTGGNQGVLVRF